jgi:hypothetical protein
MVLKELDTHKKKRITEKVFGRFLMVSDNPSKTGNNCIL